MMWNTHYVRTYIQDWKCIIHDTHTHYSLKQKWNKINKNKNTLRKNIPLHIFHINVILMIYKAVIYLKLLNCALYIRYMRQRKYLYIHTHRAQPRSAQCVVLYALYFDTFFSTSGNFSFVERRRLMTLSSCLLWFISTFFLLP